MRKYTIEEVKEYYSERGYDVLDDEYEDYSSKLHIKERKTGYLYVSTFAHFSNGELTSPFGYNNKEYQEYNIKLFLSNNFNDTKFISARKEKRQGKTRNIITLQCPCCDKNFEREWSHIYYSKCDSLMCPKCTNKAKTIKKRKQRDLDAISKIESYGYHFEGEKPKHIYGNELIEVVENKTGYKVMVNATKLKDKKKNIVFSEFTNRHNLLYNTNQYILNNDLDCKAIRIAEEKGRTPNDKSIIECRCSCGRLFYTDVYNLMENINRCEVCRNAISHDEFLVSQFLDDNNIKYKEQFRFNSCKYKKPLPFDFHLDDYDILIEIDGEQHFRPVRFGGMSQEEAEENFQKQKNKDSIKNDFCKKHNIPLLRISYEEINNEQYKDKILNFIKTVQD